MLKLKPSYYRSRELAKDNVATQPVPAPFIQFKDLREAGFILEEMIQYSSKIMVGVYHKDTKEKRYYIGTVVAPEGEDVKEILLPSAEIGEI